MSNRNCAAVNVDQVQRNTQLLDTVNRLTRKFFVEFPQIDVTNSKPHPVEQAGHRVDWTNPHYRWVAPGGCIRGKEAQRCQSALLRLFLGGDEAGARSIRQLRRVAGGS